MQLTEHLFEYDINPLRWVATANDKECSITVEAMTNNQVKKPQQYAALYLEMLGGL